MDLEFGNSWGVTLTMTPTHAKAQTEVPRKLETPNHNIQSEIETGKTLPEMIPSHTRFRQVSKFTMCQIYTNGIGGKQLHANC